MDKLPVIDMFVKWDTSSNEKKYTYIQHESHKHNVK